MLSVSESIVTYSAPRGEAESSLEDLSYDGILDGSHMRGGLGQLVDGLFGDDHIQDHTPGKLTSAPLGSCSGYDESKGNRLYSLHFLLCLASVL
jgi:hypothetical protein